MEPWTLDSPRRALTPPPAIPMLPSRSLDDGHGPDVLNADGVLGPSHGVQYGPGLVLRSGGGIRLVDLQQVFYRGSGNVGDLLRGVAGIVFFQELEDASGF